MNLTKLGKKRLGQQLSSFKVKNETMLCADTVANPQFGSENKAKNCAHVFARPVYRVHFKLQLNANKSMGKHKTVSQQIS